jgi:hypothetical protein
MDPVSCVALATGAYKTLKAAISTGKDIQEMGNTIATWGQAFSDFNRLEERQKNPPWWQKTFKGSDEEEAILIWNQRRKMDEMRKEIKDHISFVYGPSSWDEILRIEAEQRRKRKEEAYKKQEFIDNLVNWAIGLTLFFVSGSLLGFIIWAVGRARGDW